MTTNVSKPFWVVTFFHEELKVDEFVVVQGADKEEVRNTLLANNLTPYPRGTADSHTYFDKLSFTPAPEYQNKRIQYTEENWNAMYDGIQNAQGPLEINENDPWWWFSFADATGWLGGAYIQGKDFPTAHTNISRKGWNPGGEVRGSEVALIHMPDKEWTERFYADKAQFEELGVHLAEKAKAAQA